MAVSPTPTTKPSYHNALEAFGYPKMELKTLTFSYTTSEDPIEKGQIKAKIINYVNDYEMASYYKQLCSVLSIPMDSQLLAQIEEKNTSKISDLEVKVKDAQENLGDVDILESLTDCVLYFCKTGNKSKALSAIRHLCDREISNGMKIELGLAKIRIGLLYDDMELVHQSLAVINQIVEIAGDWDKRNKVKIYEGLVLFYDGNFLEASSKLCSCLATFASSELISYKDFVRYTIIACAESFSRPELKQKIIDSPEINEVINQLPLYCKLVDSFYGCQYSDFIRTVMELVESLKADCYASRHRYHFLREMTFKAYSQLLQSYSSLTLEAMARTFMVSVQFIEQEISFWIARGRLCCAIDKELGLVEVFRPDNRSLQYLQYVEKCDGLITRTQKIVRKIKI